MKKESFLSGVSGRSWLRETQIENKLTRQVYRLSERGFVDYPETGGLTKQQRIAELARAVEEGEAQRQSKIKELEASIEDNRAHIGKDADLKVQYALTGADDEKFDKLKKLLDDIKKAKEYHASTSDLYAELWEEIDSYEVLQDIENETKTGESNRITPF